MPGKWNEQVERDDVVIKGTKDDIVVPCVAINFFSKSILSILFFFLIFSVMGVGGVGKSTVRIFIHFCIPCLMLIEMIHSSCTSSSTPSWARTLSPLVMTSGFAPHN